LRLKAAPAGPPLPENNREQLTDITQHSPTKP
jgi:hypothetical protein